MLIFRIFIAAALYAPVSFASDSYACQQTSCISFPDDSGIINVKDFGAKGDGISDDTASINAALTASGDDTGPTFWHDRIVYFPDGTYLVSAPIAKHYKNGKFASGSMLVGQERSKTIIKLKDKAAGYDNPHIPKAIIFTTAKLLDGSPTSGGKDYTNKGEGNDAFMNFVENMTIDAGNGNAGAIGIDYLANNIGALRNILVRTGSGSGHTGIAMTRKWPGPALLQDVTVEGFDTGIDVDNTEYGVTMERILLENQQTGLRNNHNEIAVHDLTIRNAVHPLVNLSPDGLIVVDKGLIEKQPSGNEAFENKGYININKLAVKGYKTAFGMSVHSLINAVYYGNQLMPEASTAWSLPVENFTGIEGESREKWVSVEKFGAKADSQADATTAIRKAFNSGAATIYFPHGTYLISDNITIPESVQHIYGMTSTIHVYKQRQPGFRRDIGMFRAYNNKRPLAIEKLAFDNSYLGDQVAIEADGNQPVLLRDVTGAGVTTLLRPESGGKAFIENSCCGTVSVAGSQGVWARQLNSEGPGIRVKNSGAPLWILGIKTEHDCTILDNYNGAQTEILGGLLYITGNKANPDIPAFRNTDSHIMLSYAEESFDTHATYSIHILNTVNGIVKKVGSDSLPKRNTSHIAPGLNY